MGEFCSTHTGKMRMHTKFQAENLEARDYLGDINLDTDGRIILR
jgi:hypothetical protein